MSDDDYESVESPDTDNDSPDNSYEMQYPARRGNSHERKNPFQVTSNLKVREFDVFVIVLQSEWFEDVH